MSTFNLQNFLIENKLTTNSKLLNEVKSGDKVVLKKDMVLTSLTSGRDDYRLGFEEGDILTLTSQYLWDKDDFVVTDGDHEFYIPRDAVMFKAMDKELPKDVADQEKTQIEKDAKKRAGFLKEGYHSVLRLVKGTMEYMMKMDPELDRETAFDVAKEQVEDVLGEEGETLQYQEDIEHLNSITLEDLDDASEPVKELKSSTRRGMFDYEFSKELNRLVDRWKVTPVNKADKFFEDGIKLFQSYRNQLSTLKEEKNVTYSDKEHGIEQLVVVDDSNVRKLKAVINENQTILELDDYEVTQKLGSGYAEGLGYYYSSDHPDHKFVFNINLAQEGPEYEPVEVGEFVESEFIGGSSE